MKRSLCITLPLLVMFALLTPAFATGVFFTKVEGTARLYVNGKYIGSEDFKADPLIPVPSLQAATIIEYSDGFEVGDTVTVYFDGPFDTASHGSRDIYQSTTLEVVEL